MRRYHEDESPASETTLDEQDQQMLDEVIKRGRRRWRVKDRTVPPEPSSHAADVSGLLLVRYAAAVVGAAGGRSEG